jgi:uncharacterized protein involved in copper resistance
VAVLQPEKHEADERDQDVGVEDDPGVAGREVPGHDHLIDVAARSAPEEHRRADHRREPQIEAAPEGEKAHDGKPRLANPTSAWNGLSSQPMKRAVISPKKVCITKS